MANEEFDAIVVGSGISGGWAAKELTEKGLNVLLLERGKNVEHIKDYVNARKHPWEFPHRGRRTREMEEAYPVLRRDYPLNEKNLDWWASDQDSPIRLLHSPDHVFVDLRDGGEQASTGIIPGAIASSRGMMEFHIDPDSPAHKPELNQDKTYVFYCASGGRSALVAVVAMDMGLAPVVNLAGGVSAWKKAGGKLDVSFKT